MTPQGETLAVVFKVYYGEMKKPQNKQRKMPSN